MNLRVTMNLTIITLIYMLLWIYLLNMLRWWQLKPLLQRTHVKDEVLSLCKLNVGPRPYTGAQHWISIGTNFRVTVCSADLLNHLRWSMLIINSITVVKQYVQISISLRKALTLLALMMLSFTTRRMVRSPHLALSYHTHFTAQFDFAVSVIEM